MLGLSGIIDDFKARLDLTVKSVIAAAILGFAGMAAFVCVLVVLFLWVLQNYGLMQAWGTIGGVFGVIAVAATIPLMSASRRRRELARIAEQRAAKAEAEKKRDAADWWQNPATLLTGIQLARTLGIKGTLPILALAAVAAGYMMTRQPADDPEAPIEPAE